MLEGKYSALKRSPIVNCWLTNLARGSPITAEVSLRRLGGVCELLNTSPQSLVRNAGMDFKGL